MALRLSIQKTKQTPTRKLKFLPRIGLTLDFAGRQFTFKQAPLLETMANLKREKLNLKSFASISNQILDEIFIEKKRKQMRKKKVTTKK